MNDDSICTLPLTTHNSSYNADKEAVSKALDNARGTLSDDDLLECLMDYIKGVQRNRKFSLAASFETEQGSLEYVGGGIIAVKMVQLMNKHMRQRAGWLRLLLAKLHCHLRMTTNISRERS